MEATLILGLDRIDGLFALSGKITFGIETDLFCLTSKKYFLDEPQFFRLVAWLNQWTD